MEITQLFTEIGLTILAGGTLLWANYKFNIFINVMSIYGVIVLSPLILLGTIVFGLNLMIKEKNGMDLIGECYMYQPMTWVEYIKFKYTGEGHKYACEG